MNSTPRFLAFMSPAFTMEDSKAAIPTGGNGVKITIEFTTELSFSADRRDRYQPGPTAQESAKNLIRAEGPTYTGDCTGLQPLPSSNCKPGPLAQAGIGRAVGASLWQNRLSSRHSPPDEIENNHPN